MSIKLKSYLLIILSFIFIMNTTTYAEECKEESINDGMQVNLVKSDETRYYVDKSEITTTTYYYDDGTIIVDTLTVDNILSRSTSGSTSAEKTRSAKGKAGNTIMSVILYATFDWNKGANDSYCTSAYTSEYINSAYTTSTWDIDVGYYHILGIDTGSSYACLNYYLYETKYPAYYHTGELNIKCTSSGKIS